MSENNTEMTAAVPAPIASAPVQAENLFQSMTDTHLSYCSFEADTDEKKALLFNAMTNPTHRVSDAVNTVIRVRDVYVETVDVTDRNTGELRQLNRTVLIDTDGESWQTSSVGVFSALAKLFRVLGAPTWESGVPLKVIQINRGENRLLSLEMVR